MQIGFVGLGKMGGNMVERLLGADHQVAVYNKSREKIEEYAAKGALPSGSLEELTERLEGRKAIWLMVPSGEPVDQNINDLIPLLSPRDIIIDGGNSYYKDTLRRHELLKKHQIHLVDCGTSGGIWGLTVGYCLMIGGETNPVKFLEPVFRTLAPTDGFLHCGASGAGHLVKMVHNGIEYGMMQAYAEGFDILQASPYGLDLQKIAHLWNQGSVVRSWLLELADLALQKDPGLDGLEPWVADSGEGRWTVFESIERDVPAPVLTLALQSRLASRDKNSFAHRLLAALRNEFGGHAVKSRK
ncbi:MAG: decarboxylating 6-phosphogluconate dehydrogenase [Ignavibacteria bacterium]|nr:decarboxylating 6-phosphogluconate dehydrogenase [Ignavibacteria bacterium]